MITGFALLLLLLLLLALAKQHWGAPGLPTQGTLPPGPKPLPLLGNLLLLKSGRQDRVLMELSGRWGPVFTVWLGPRPAVVLCGYAALRDALVLQADSFSGRGAMAPGGAGRAGDPGAAEWTGPRRLGGTEEVRRRSRAPPPARTPTPGIVFSNGPRWRALRSFALGALKELGLGSRTVEERVLEEAACLLGELQATSGTPFDPRRLLDSAVSNVICSVVFGKRYGYEDPEFLRLLDLFHDNFCIVSSRWGEMYNIFPSLLDWLPGPHHRIFQNFAELRVFISAQIQQHRQTRRPGEHRDFIDCFLDQMDKEQQDPESHFQEETLVMTTHNLFFGGTETTSTTLRYGLLILLKYPEVAAKMQAELDSVVGRTHAPSLEDRARLPYTNAVLHEIQRFISVLPLGLPRALTRNASLHGHLLPKGTVMIPLLVSAHRDPTQFKSPDCFNPANFLDDKGQFQSNDAFMPFAPGKRMCPGAGLARSEIFLFFTAILQQFCLLPVGSPAHIDLTPQCTGLGNIPPAFQLRLVAR
ncbi:PREDICTED: cytochrome P450 2F5-like [Condylura cristata]|uniref:cytochrome P450 2F5-like n=1 Tax=Condylura cristata TaxID=143302 RepID=UPI0006431CC0|nr:PREDICTED: cytochrome P450 2F5-like [Condylura cristata]